MHTLSLIVATINRSNEIGLLLSSLEKQNYKNFEVVIVDQNTDRRIQDIISSYNNLNIIHVQIPSKGASNARNIGASLSHGKILAFPDDDCTYFHDTTEKAIFLFKQGADLITGKCIDEKGMASVANFMQEKIRITPYNVWDSGVESTLFLKRELFNKLNGFNESLGVGTKPYGAGEGTDLILRALKYTANIYFSPDLLVQHPQVNIQDASSYKRAFSYGMGIGRVHRLNKTPLISKARSLFRPLLATIVYFCLFNLKKSKFHLLSLCGRTLGLLHKIE